MSDLFKKINVLLRSNLSGPRGDEAPPPLSKNVERDVAELRRRINDALSYEDGLKARAAALQAEVARWDTEADRAVVAGDDATARHAVEQMQRASQRLDMAEADLRDHQRVTQELIQRVNMLDAAVADARRAQAADAAPSGESLSGVLREAGERIASLGSLIAAKDEAAKPAAPQAPVDVQTIDDDLESRRQRLSK